VRAFVGGQLGSHGNGLIRPYMGLNLALLVYSYTTDSLPLSDAPADNSSPRDVWTTSETAFGWDANAGIDLDFHEHWMLDVGVRYVHSTGVPRAPAFSAVRFDPAYLQYRVGIGFGHSNAVQD
jgi:opacity protein-like surface antigen